MIEAWSRPALLHCGVPLMIEAWSCLALLHCGVPQLMSIWCYATLQLWCQTEAILIDVNLTILWRYSDVTLMSPRCYSTLTIDWIWWYPKSDDTDETQMKYRWNTDEAQMKTPEDSSSLTFEIQNIALHCAIVPFILLFIKGEINCYCVTLILHWMFFCSSVIALSART